MVPGGLVRKLIDPDENCRNLDREEDVRAFSDLRDIKTALASLRD